MVTAAPALFAFMGSASSSEGLSAWRWACVPPRFGSGCFHIGQRKPIIRTHPLSEEGSDYMGLVRETGLEPVRRRHTHLKRACLPVPALAQITRCIIPLEACLVKRYFSPGAFKNKAYCAAGGLNTRQIDGFQGLMRFFGMAYVHLLTAKEKDGALWSQRRLYVKP